MLNRDHLPELLSSNSRTESSLFLPQVEAVRRVMSELNLTVVEMDGEQGDSVGATLEGSDILFTGREFFVGISSHTNRRGAEVLADTFRVRAIEGGEGTMSRRKLFQTFTSLGLPVMKAHVCL